MAIKAKPMMCQCCRSNKATQYVMIVIGSPPGYFHVCGDCLDKYMVDLYPIKISKKTYLEAKLKEAL